MFKTVSVGQYGQVDLGYFAAPSMWELAILAICVLLWDVIECCGKRECNVNASNVLFQEM